MNSVNDSPANANFDSILIVSFGGPEGMDDVMPFLRNVTSGRNVPDERLMQVAKHYELFGGVSPINEQNRMLIAALKTELEVNGPHLPIFWGNRNWKPYLTDALSEMRELGKNNALAFFTSAYSSYSGCRQYRENIEHAREEIGGGAPQVHKLRAFYNHPGFIESNADAVVTALGQIPPQRRDKASIAFTAHSIPESMSAGCDYKAQLLEASRLTTEMANHGNWDLVFQSRSGPPTQPWLEPNICDHLRGLKEKGVTDVVVSPIGFVSDHLEVRYDLDTEAANLAAELGLNMIRAATPGTHPRFIRMIRELIIERMDSSVPRLFLGERGPRNDRCEPDCCLPGIGRPSRVQ